MAHSPFSALYQAYLEADPALAPFYGRYPADADTLAAAARSLAWAGDRPTLVRDLTAFNRRHGADAAAIANIGRLAEAAAVTVVTGQQTTVFGGPYYTLFKALTTVARARELEARLGTPVVPVFWLADEDNDYSEIGSLHLPTREGVRRFDLAPAGNAAHSAGFLPLGPDFDRFKADVRAALPQTEHLESIWATIETAYQGAGTHAHAFGRLILAATAGMGLVLAGSTDTVLKRRMAPVLVRYVERHDNARQALETVSAQLEARYHRQAVVGPSLLFRHHPEKGRMRVDTLDATLAEEVATHPDRFSPNVFLRPLLQDTLLPNIAYVAGPGETAYYAQMNAFYEVMDQQMPVILPRFSATLMEPSAARHADALPFEWHELQGRIEDLEAEFLKRSRSPDVDAFVADWVRHMHHGADARRAWVAAVDATLVATTESVLKEQEHALDKLRQKLLRSVKQQEETGLRRLRQVSEHLFPDGHLQERHLGWVHLWVRYGPDFPARLLDIVAAHPGGRHEVVRL